MKLKAYEEKMDLILFYQMKELIRRMTKKPMREENSLFGYQKLERTMEEQYELRYPGEVLERYKERCGDDIRRTRALALAVAEEKNLLEPFMFTGTQMIDFMAVIRQQAETDLYLAGALYLLTDRKEERAELENKLLQYDCKDTPEAIFLISILSETDWKYKAGLASRFLGKERSIKAYGNICLYSWILEKYHNEIRNSRCKNMYLLKTFLSLPCKYVKAQTPAYLRLIENGYSHQEILYMNFMLPLETNIPDTLYEKSITMERMALENCRELLNSVEMESAELYVLCEYQLKAYERYEIKLEEKSGIVESLQDMVRLKNAETFRFLYEMKYSNIPNKWFFVDIGGEETWDILAEWFPLEQFRIIFERSLCYQENPDIDCWLNKYRKLTEKDYSDLFWHSDKYDTREVFHLMVQNKKCDPTELLRLYHEDEMKYTEEEVNKKWHFMMSHIRSVVYYLDSHETFCFWAEFDKIYGIAYLDDFLRRSNGVLREVKIYGESLNQFSFSFPFLSYEEQKIVFNWMEQMVYLKLPKRYGEFLYQFLLCDAAQALFPVESKELFREIESDGTWQMSVLYQKYYSQEEWKVYQEAEKAKKEAEKQKEEQRIADKLNASLQKITEISANTSEMYDMLSKIVSDNLFADDKRVDRCIAFLEEQIDEKGGQMNKGSIRRLLESFGTLIFWGGLKWDILKRILTKIEVVENESEKNNAA